MAKFTRERYHLLLKVAGYGCRYRQVVTAHIWKECVVVKVEEEVPETGESKGNGQEREMYFEIRRKNNRQIKSNES